MEWLSTPVVHCSGNCCSFSEAIYFGTLRNVWWSVFNGGFVPRPSLVSHRGDNLWRIIPEQRSLPGSCWRYSRSVETWAQYHGTIGPWRPELSITPTSVHSMVQQVHGDLSSIYWRTRNVSCDHRFTHIVWYPNSSCFWQTTNVPRITVKVHVDLSAIKHVQQANVLRTDLVCPLNYELN